MNAEIFNSMPDRFTRRDLLKAVIDRGYAANKADQMLERFTISGELERIERGRFQKQLQSQKKGVNNGSD